MKDEDLFSLVAYVQNSSYRLKVLESIGNELKKPKVISEDINIRINHVSTSLSELKKKKIIECINEDMKKGRIYRTTETGKEVLNFLKSEKIK